MPVRTGLAVIEHLIITLGIPGQSVLFSPNGDCHRSSVMVRRYQETRAFSARMPRRGWDGNAFRLQPIQLQEQVNKSLPHGKMVPLGLPVSSGIVPSRKWALRENGSVLLS